MPSEVWETPGGLCSLRGKAEKRTARGKASLCSEKEFFVQRVTKPP